MHAALCLVIVLAGVGATFILLGAEFIGITQVLVYIGAIVVLFLFGIMLTRAPIGTIADLTGTRLGDGAGRGRWRSPACSATCCIDFFGDTLRPHEYRRASSDPSVRPDPPASEPIEQSRPRPTVQRLDLRRPTSSRSRSSASCSAALIGAIVLARKD